MRKMSTLSFHLMAKWLNTSKVNNELVESLGIKNGDTVIDYGCGTGRYLNSVVPLVGNQGKVYAVDIHELAIKYVEKRMKKYSMKNVVPVLANGYSSSIKNNTADVIYALDMFHNVDEPDTFMKELHRIIKANGHLIIDDGHKGFQSRKETRNKLLNSGLWKITDEKENHIRLEPVKN